MHIYVLMYVYVCVCVYITIEAVMDEDMVALQEARRVTLICYRALVNRNIQVVAKWKISNKFERIATLFKSNAPKLKRWVYLKDF